MVKVCFVKYFAVKVHRATKIYTILSFFRIVCAHDSILAGRIIVEPVSVSRIYSGNGIGGNGMVMTFVYVPTAREILFPNLVRWTGQEANGGSGKLRPVHTVTSGGQFADEMSYD